jgi:hypothetical protein
LTPELAHLDTGPFREVGAGLLNRAAGISKSGKYVLFAYTRTDRQTDRQTTLTYLSSVRVLQAGGRCVLSCAEVFSKYGGINNGTNALLITRW